MILDLVDGRRHGLEVGFAGLGRFRLCYLALFLEETCRNVFILRQRVIKLRCGGDGTVADLF